MADLEQRLERMESLVGTAPDKVVRSRLLQPFQINYLRYIFLLLTCCVHLLFCYAINATILLNVLIFTTMSHSLFQSALTVETSNKSLVVSF